MNKNPQLLKTLKYKITKLQKHLQIHKHDFNGLKIIKKLKHKHKQLLQPLKTSSMVKW
ncbi:hypothetical protein JS520_00255 [Candidatus Vidania fulgoroideae]|nr:hypothetical protein JS520_00255 [Candidatus Vidania fulgoroideae]